LDFEHGQISTPAATRCKWHAPTSSPAGSSTARKDDYSSRDSSSSPSLLDAHTPPSHCDSRRITAESSISSSIQSSLGSARADSPVSGDGVRVGTQADGHRSPSFVARGLYSDMPAMHDYHAMLTGSFGAAPFSPSVRCASSAHDTSYDCSFGTADFFLTPPFSGLDDGVGSDYKPNFRDYVYDADGSPNDNRIGPGNCRTSVEPSVGQSIPTSHDDSTYRPYMPRSDSVDALTPGTPLTPSDSGTPLSLIPPMIGRETDAVFWLPSSAATAHCARGDIRDSGDMFSTSRFWELDGSFNWATPHT
jgi:hypothetical protein